MDQCPCQEGDSVSGMLCHLCRKHFKRPPKSVFGKATSVDVPCVTLNHKAVLRHSRSPSHQDAITAETNLGMGFMESAYKEAISVEWKSIIGRFKCLYWLCKEEVAHITKFESLLELGKSLGVEYLDAVCQGGNAQ